MGELSSTQKVSGGGQSAVSFGSQRGAYNREHQPGLSDGGGESVMDRFGRAKKAVGTFGKFIGPGFMVAVAYSRFDVSLSQADEEWLTD